MIVFILDWCLSVMNVSSCLVLVLVCVRGVNIDFVLWNIASFSHLSSSNR